MAATVLPLYTAPAAVPQVRSGSRGQARKPMILFDFSGKPWGLTLPAVRISARHQEVARCQAGDTPYASCTYAVLSALLLIRRSLVRAQVGEPKKMRASFARGWPFVVSGRGVCPVRCVHRYMRILRTRVMGLSRDFPKSPCTATVTRSPRFMQSSRPPQPGPRP
jgi:hypothetical protein